MYSLWLTELRRLAHWDGLQPYSDENTSKSNLVSPSFPVPSLNGQVVHRTPHRSSRYSPPVKATTTSYVPQFALPAADTNPLHSRSM